MLWQQVRSRTGGAGGSPQTGSDADEAPKRAPPSTPVKAKQVDSPMAPLLSSDPKHHGSHTRAGRWRQALMLGVGTVLLLLWFNSWDTPIDLTQDSFVKVDGIQVRQAVGILWESVAGGSGCGRKDGGRASARKGWLADSSAKCCKA